MMMKIMMSTLSHRKISDLPSPEFVGSHSLELSVIIQTVIKIAMIYYATPDFAE